MGVLVCIIDLEELTSSSWSELVIMSDAFVLESDASEGWNKESPSSDSSGSDCSESVIMPDALVLV